MGEWQAWSWGRKCGEPRRAAAGAVWSARVWAGVRGPGHTARGRSLLRNNPPSSVSSESGQEGELGKEVSLPEGQTSEALSPVESLLMSTECWVVV